MARNYVSWNNSRGDSGNALENRPHITNSANGKRYYSSIDAEIYFGNIFIDEVTSIEWAVQQQAMPIFGYNSYCFDDIAVGSRLIQGQFAVNFTESGFLMNLQKDSNWTRLARKLYSEDNPAESYFTDDFRRRLNMPIWDGGFDIVVGFGDQGQKVSELSNSEWKTYLVLDCCQLTGSMLQLDYNGVPVQEVYTFIARDIKYSTATASEIKPYEPSESEGTVDKAQLKVQGVIESYGENQLAARIKCLNNLILQEANMSFVTTFTDKTLMNKFEMTTDKDGDLIYIFDKDKSKSLKKEIADLVTITGRGMITHYKSELDKSKGTVSVANTIYFNVNV